MEHNVQRNSLINALVLLVIGVAGFAVARVANSLAGHVSITFVALGFLVAAVSWFQMRLEQRERLERLELDELKKSRATSTLFEAGDAELFPAQRSREQFERYFVPAFTVVLFLLELAGAFLVWRWLSKTGAFTAVKQPTMALALFAVFALVLFLLGRFSATIARLEDHRLLRPGASFLLLGAYICALTAVGLILVWSGFERADYVLAFVLCGLLALVAVETLLTLLLELYRPRLKGKVGRPLYESRLVGLLSQPEGLITTAAQALDYQFGFKVSETGFYKFFEKWLRWLVLAQVAVLLVSTMIVFIDAGEEALLERNGRPVAGRPVLGPGAHVKWFWPIDKVYRYRTEQIQSFEIGTVEETDSDGHGDDHGPQANPQSQVVLWTVAHTKEENFLVGNRSPTAGTNDVAGKRTPPVSLLTGSIPVQFQITNLTAWAYQNENSFALLEALATREVVRYLVGVDMNEIMSHGRLEATENLLKRIQTAANERGLGARIVSVGLQDLHPPVKVAPDYEKVVAAIQTKQAKILGARAEDVRTNALAQAQAAHLVNQAVADQTRNQVSALARAALFTNQIPAFKAAPAVYAQRAYLGTFARSTANARKYLFLTTNTHDVYQIDLQEKIRGDILNELSVPPPQK